MSKKSNTQVKYKSSESVLKYSTQVNVLSYCPPLLTSRASCLLLPVPSPSRLPTLASWRALQGSAPTVLAPSLLQPPHRSYSALQCGSGRKLPFHFHYREFYYKPNVATIQSIFTIRILVVKLFHTLQEKLQVCLL